MTYIPLDNTRGVPLHPSHVIVESDVAPDPHNPGWLCTTCLEYNCALCDLREDDPLALPCEGGL